LTIVWVGHLRSSGSSGRETGFAWPSLTLERISRIYCVQRSVTKARTFSRGRGEVLNKYYCEGYKVFNSALLGPQAGPENLFDIQQIGGRKTYRFV
jgi:hypothetical protein